MKIRKVEIRHFRGINRLDWTVPSNFVCLIGSGDSTKSTILEAIEYALSPRWNLSFDDTDFYQVKTDSTIFIRVTVGDLPAKLTTLSKYHGSLRGWSKTGQLNDEPKPDDESVLTVQLRVDDSLEPVWTAYTDRTLLEDAKRFSAKDRERLGAVKLGSYVDRHLTWSKGSVLSKLTGDLDTMPSILAEANRKALQVVDLTSVKELPEAAQKVSDYGKEIGVKPTGTYDAKLDLKALSLSVGGISLHDDQVPVRNAGLGTKRLLALALQRSSQESNGISLVDELEHGLEPHRIRRLLQVLRKNEGQVILTTHSPVVVTELKATDLCLVRSSGGVTKVLSIGRDMQAVVRSCPDAFLAKKVIVCEGATEVGFCRALDNHWANQHQGSPFAYSGITQIDGGGTSAAGRAKALKELQYEVAFVVDTDVPTNPSIGDLTRAGIEIISWNDNSSVEKRLISDLPWKGVLEILNEVFRVCNDESSVRDSINSAVNEQWFDKNDSIENWDDKPEVRTGIVFMLEKKKWLKNISGGEKLGEISIKHLDNMSATDSAIKVEKLKTWASED